MTWASATMTLGRYEREPLAERVPEPAGQAPLGALALDAVHVERHLRAAQPRQEGDQGVGGVQEQDGVVAVEDGVQRTHRRVRDGLQVLATQPADPAAAHPGRERPRLVGAAAIRVDGDLVATGRQLARQLPGHRLEAPVRRRDAAAAEDGEPHGLRPFAWAISGTPGHELDARTRAHKWRRHRPKDGSRDYDDCDGGG